MIPRKVPWKEKRCARAQVRRKWRTSWEKTTGMTALWCDGDGGFCDRANPEP